MKMKKLSLCVSILLLSHYANAADYNNPQIDSVLATGGAGEAVPNVFFTLDSSGSMVYTEDSSGEYAGGIGKMPYDATADYTIPPNPDSADFSPYPETVEIGGTSYDVGNKDNSSNISGHNGKVSGFHLFDDAQTSGYQPNGYNWNNGYYDGACNGNSQNCKNFRAYYGSRMLALQSSLATALIERKPKIRVGYQTLSKNSDATEYAHLFQDDDTLLSLNPDKASYEANMKTFLKWLYNQQGYGSTPVRPRMSDVKAAMYDTSGNLKDAVLDNNVCRQNFSIVLSDGAWNAYAGWGDSDTWTPPEGDYDGKDHTWTLTDSDNNKQSVSFKGDGSIHQQRLFAGGTDSTYAGSPNVPAYALGGGLADIALAHWGIDLDNDSSNNDIPPFYTEKTSGSQAELWNPKNDPANWQRITTYTIGLAVGQEWTETQLDKITSGNNVSFVTEQGGDDSIIPPSWQWEYDNGLPDHSVNNPNPDRPNGDTAGKFEPRHIQDFVRAGYVGRGGFYRVDTPNDLVAAFEEIFEDIENRSTLTAPSGGSVSAAQVTSTSNSIMLTVQSDYEERSGTVIGNWLYNGRAATPSDPLPGDADQCFGTAATSSNYIGEMCTASGAKWSAADNLPAWESRKIFSYDGTNGVKFDDATVFPVAGLTTENVIKYIKGDQSQESNSAVRVRSGGILGDIGHSAPIFVGNPDNRVWKETTKPERTKMVYVGANDGMLHAFNAETGVEKFAYFPQLLLTEAKLANLIESGKAHEAFVDGQIAVQDVKDESSNNRTVLVAGLGAGGKGLFALDVTNPDAFDESKVLWEFSDTTLGKVLGKPSIIRVEGTYFGKTDRWVVVVGTGYGNGTQSGVLVLDAVTGDKLQFLELPNAQGVGEIAWIDHQKYTKVDDLSATYLSDNGYMGEMDRGYVGDLQGNLWVLDFAYDKASTATTLKSGLYDSSNVAEPLFTATDTSGEAQQITSGVVTAPHPSNRGVMVYFGTGDLFSVTPLSSVQNSMYGIWDDFGANYGNISTADVETNNKHRTREYLTYYPWEQKTGQFSDGTAVYYRQVGASSTGETALTTELKQPIVWANTGPYGDSESKDPTTDYTGTVAMPSSGWVFDAKKGERISQKAYSIVNERGESGITFLLYSEKTDSGSSSTSDLCGGEAAEFYTWNMSMRTDIIDGPATPFSYVHTDNNQDGNVDGSDTVTVTDASGVQTTLVPMGAVSGKATLENTEFGEKGLISPPIVTGSLGVTSGACSGGDIRTYKKLDETGTATQVRICIPRTASAFSEIE